MIERAWLAAVDLMESVSTWRPVRFVQVSGYSLLAGFASGPFIAPDAAALVGIGTAAAATVAYRVADVRREHNLPSARAARAAAETKAKLAAIATGYATENATRRAQQASKRADQQVQAWGWERLALLADGGALEPPAGQRIIGDFLTPNERRARTKWQAQQVGQLGPGFVRAVITADGNRVEYRTMQAFGPTGYGGAPPPAAKPGRPACWCMPYGWNARLEIIEEHYWTAHTEPRPYQTKETKK